MEISFTTRSRGFILAVQGVLDRAAIDELASILLLEAMLEPVWALLDLGAVTACDAAVAAHLRRWLQIYDHVDSQLFVRLPQAADSTDAP